MDIVYSVERFSVCLPWNSDTLPHGSYINI